MTDTTTQHGDLPSHASRGESIAPNQKVAPIKPYSIMGILIFTLFSLLWEEVPFVVLGVSVGTASRHIYSMICLAGTIVYFAKRGFRRLDAWEYLPLVLFASCFMSSLISSTWIFPIPFTDWIFASYTITPMLIIFMLRLAGCRLQDAIISFYIVGIMASILCIIHMRVNIYFLMAYYRDSGFDSDLRIVFLKLQATIAAVIGISKFLSSTTIRGRIGHGLATVVILFYVVVISESRLSMLSIGLTCILAFLFVLRGRQRVLAFIGGVAGAVVVVPYVINKYLGEFTTWDNYMANDVSASFRQIEYQHFMAFFYKTYGIGFGFMGRAPDKDNILAFAGHYGGWLYGTQDYGLNPDDNGLWAALYQYGYHGFALVVFMTLFMAIALIRVSVITRGYIVAGFLGCFVISQLMSPVPLNFFTLEYSGYIGGLIWFMAAQCDLIRKRVVAFTEFGADPATRNNRRRTLPSTRRSI